MQGAGEEGDHVTDYPSSLDYRDKGHVTSVTSLASYIDLATHYHAIILQFLGKEPRSVWVVLGI